MSIKTRISSRNPKKTENRQKTEESELELDLPDDR